MVSEMFLVDEQSEDPATMIHNRQQANQVIRENLLQAQEQIKFFADQNKKERELAVGDMVYLKGQPYRHTSLSLHRCIKLHSKFYGPFRVIEKVGETAYKLLLPEGSSNIPC
jgi:hypothetical protein